MEKSEAPSRKREAIALFIAMIALVIAIIFISLTY
jgi:hypothetical protein